MSRGIHQDGTWEQLTEEQRAEVEPGYVARVRKPADCPSTAEHLPHDWEYRQVWGGDQTFLYRCLGIKSYTIERYTDDEDTE